MTSIYHITHIHNIKSIIECGGLWCDSAVLEQELTPQSIAHVDIKERRTRRSVPVSPDGNLANYVPFYFAPRSPMLYAVHKGIVSDYKHGQGSIVHLVTSAESIADHHIPFCFTDGHAVVQFSQFFNDLKDLWHVDQQIMQETYWNDTLEDQDRKRRRQAEFLVHTFFPWSLVTEVGVMTNRVAASVREMLIPATDQPRVTVRPGWYY